jgi:Uma2 family endonuclease
LEFALASIFFSIEINSMASQSIDKLLAEIRHSPSLPKIVEALQKQIADEDQRRQKFYCEMTPEQKVEFIDGEIVLHSPAKNKHLIATNCISGAMRLFVIMNHLGAVYTEKCLCTFPRNDYEPDVVFFGKEKAATFEPDTLQFPVPDLVVEVLSDSTEKRDRGVKFDDYEAQGVQEYWIVDTEKMFVEQYLLEDVKFVLQMKSNTGTVTSRVLDGFSVPVECLFDETKNIEFIRKLLL